MEYMIKSVDFYIEKIYIYTHTYTQRHTHTYLLLSLKLFIPLVNFYLKLLSFNQQVCFCLTENDTGFPQKMMYKRHHCFKRHHSCQLLFTFEQQVAIRICQGYEYFWVSLYMFTVTVYSLHNKQRFM